MNATNATSEAPRQAAGETAPPNRLYYGDCLTIMQDMPAGSVDLIYLDPPFNSNRAYNAIYRDETGRPLPDQIEAFCDLWELDIERERVIRDLPAAMRAAGIDGAGTESWRSCAIGLRGRNPAPVRRPARPAKGRLRAGVGPGTGSGPGANPPATGGR